MMYSVWPHVREEIRRSLRFLLRDREMDVTAEVIALQPLRCMGSTDWAEQGQQP